MYVCICARVRQGLRVIINHVDVVWGERKREKRHKGKNKPVQEKGRKCRTLAGERGSVEP